MSEQPRQGATTEQDRSVAQLVQDMTEQVRRLVRDELRLAVEELRRKGKRAGVGAGLTGVAGLLAFFGGATLVACAVLALALVVPGWAAALIVGAVLLAVAGIAALTGTKQLKKATPPVPEEAMTGVRQDVDVVRQRGASDHVRA
jgi:uncharacterized membrane protein YqjE